MKLTLLFLLAIPFLHSALALPALSVDNKGHPLSNVRVYEEEGPPPPAPESPDWVKTHISTACGPNHTRRIISYGMTTYSCENNGIKKSGSLNHGTLEGTHTEIEGNTKTEYNTIKGEGRHNVIKS